MALGLPEPSLQVTIVVSQLLSSPLRDHYAVLLLLPMAWLVDRGRTWAVVFPLAGWMALFAGDAWLPTASIPLTFFGGLALLLWEAIRERRSVPAAAAAAELRQALRGRGDMLGA